MFQHAASRHLADFFQADIAWLGGLTEQIKICHLAEAAGIAAMLHAALNMPNGQHACYAVPNIPWGEFFLGSVSGVPLEEVTLFPGQAVPRGGQLVPSAGPGIGLGASLESLEHLRA